MVRPIIVGSATALVVAMFFAAPFAFAASPPPPPEKAAVPQAAPADAVTISVARDLPDVRPYAGEPLALRITLKNSTGASVMVPDWDHFTTDEVDVRLTITGYPGESGPAETTSGFWDTSTFQKGDFRPLPPGETVLVRTVVPMVPGKARITVGFHSPSDMYVSLTDGRKTLLERAWTGHVYAGLTVNVPDEISPAMKKRYDDVRGQIADPLVPAEQKGRLMQVVAAENHIFAERFIRDLCTSLPAGRMRDVAIFELLKLAKVGTAYECVPLLLKWMGDAGIDQDTRVAIVDWAADALAHKGRMVIADQAFYTWPEAVRKQAREELQRMTKDSNPYFAARARDDLKRIAD